MAKPEQNIASYSDILALPENIVGEIVGGRLYTHPRPAPKHARAASSIGIKVGGAYDHGTNGPGGWWILDEPELHLDNDVIVPDLAGWRRERMPKLPDEAWFSLVPDWVCEVLSPSTAETDRRIKMPLYARYGVDWLWLVDPEAKTLDLYKNNDESWQHVSSEKGSVIVSIAPFEVLEFDLSLLWV